jgi:hypothetical protein
MGVTKRDARAALGGWRSTLGGTERTTPAGTVTSPLRDLEAMSPQLLFE